MDPRKSHWIGRTRKHILVVHGRFPGILVYIPHRIVGYITVAGLPIPFESIKIRFVKFNPLV